MVSCKFSLKPIHWICNWPQQSTQFLWHLWAGWYYHEPKEHPSSAGASGVPGWRTWGRSSLGTRTSVPGEALQTSENGTCKANHQWADRWRCHCTNNSATVNHWPFLATRQACNHLGLIHEQGEPQFIPVISCLFPAKCNSRKKNKY